MGLALRGQMAEDGGGQGSGTDPQSQGHCLGTIVSGTGARRGVYKDSKGSPEFGGRVDLWLRDQDLWWGGPHQKDLGQ